MNVSCLVDHRVPLRDRHEHRHGSVVRQPVVGRTYTSHIHRWHNGPARVHSCIADIIHIINAYRNGWLRRIIRDTSAMRAALASTSRRLFLRLYYVMCVHPFVYGHSHAYLGHWCLGRAGTYRHAPLLLIWVEEETPRGLHLDGRNSERAGHERGDAPGDVGVGEQGQGGPDAPVHMCMRMIHRVGGVHHCIHTVCEDM